MTFRRNPRVAARALADGEGGVLLHLDSGAYHRFNPVGFLIWDLLEEPRSMDELRAALGDRIRDAPPELEADMQSFLDAAIERDLVQSDG